ncbi:MAG: hypothetical protein L3J01_00165 [Thiomicrorhabdus sp.]|nr:hypothetical protein [Thiomicrorhabdus sp.]
MATKSFKIGETVFVAYPAGNIKDDAFIIGLVTGVSETGDYVLSVLEYVEGHDYGLSCVPMTKKSASNGEVSPYDTAWDVWQDTTVLEKEALEYLVSAQDVMSLNEGKHLFIERNNIYIVFGRWKSDAPMLSVERLEQAEKTAQDSRILPMVEALQIAQQYRRSFYDSFKRPYQAYETIAPLNRLLERILVMLEKDKVLNKTWRSNVRNWKALSSQQSYYFLLEAIDKVVADAQNQLYEEGVEKADPLIMQTFKENLARLQRKK